MSTAPILMTDCDAIRGCLGLDASECQDSVLVLSNLELELEVDLLAWIPDFQTRMDAADSPNASAEVQLTAKLLTLYSQWFCAWKLSLRPLLFLSDITNGKDKLSRFTKLDMERVSELAAANTALYRAKLDEVISSAEAPGMFTLFDRSSPDVDPITEAPA